MKKIGKNAGLILLFMIWAGFVTAANYSVNLSQSSVKWLGKKVTGEHTGNINIKNGELEVKEKTITGGSIEIDMNSIADEDLKDAGMNAKLVGHLKSDDFFSAAKFPVSRLVLTEVKRLTGNEAEFTGNLSIKGITHPVTFKAHTVFNGKVLTVVGEMVINRAKYDVRFGSSSFFEGLGDKIIYDDFSLYFKLVAYEK